jgi:hypothetical protein
MERRRCYIGASEGFGSDGNLTANSLKAAYSPQEHHANLKQNRQQAHVARD